MLLLLKGEDIKLYNSFTGVFCQEEINECNANPCLNGGECRDLLANFACICPDGFTGRSFEGGC